MLVTPQKLKLPRIEITGKTFWKISSNLCKALTIFITKEGKPSPDRNKKKPLLAFDNLFLSLRYFR